VGEGADFTRGTAGGRLTGQRERAVARFALTASEQVVHVGLLVDPGAALMLVEAHGPVGHDLATLLAVQIGQLLQLRLERIHRLVRITLGDGGGVLQRVGSDCGLEIFKADRPVLHRRGGILLLDDIAFLLALTDGFPLVEHMRLFILDDFHFQRGMVFLSILRPEAVADVIRPSSELGVLLDVIVIDGIAPDDLVCDEVLDCQVAGG
jgi:hypothetical protein